MAIYHCDVKRISRSHGRSATASAAYRAGEKIEDQRTGLTHDDQHKRNIYGSEIIAPDDAPDWAHNRSALWNEVERSEKRCDALLSLETMVALPKELSHEQKQKLTRAFVKEHFVSQGMIVDISYHDFDSHNPHVHLLTTTREVTKEGFGKKQRSWDKRQAIIDQRQAWAEQVNRALEQAGHQSRVDHRSLKARGDDRIPQEHLGARVMEMEARGIETEKGKRYRQTAAANRRIAELKQEQAELAKRIKDYWEEQAKAGEGSGGNADGGAGRQQEQPTPQTAWTVRARSNPTPAQTANDNHPEKLTLEMKLDKPPKDSKAPPAEAEEQQDSDESLKQIKERGWSSSR